LIGAVAGVVCFYAVALKNRMGWDDALDVWGVHGVGGFIGIILLGVFASTAWNPASNGGVDGLLRGGAEFFGKQLAAVAISSIWAGAATFGMLVGRSGRTASALGPTRRHVRGRAPRAPTAPSA
jgi:Amt family ammonium transporter